MAAALSVIYVVQQLEDDVVGGAWLMPAVWGKIKS